MLTHHSYPGAAFLFTYGMALALQPLYSHDVTVDFGSNGAVQKLLRNCSSQINATFSLLRQYHLSSNIDGFFGDFFGYWPLHSMPDSPRAMTYKEH